MKLFDHEDYYKTKYDVHTRVKTGFNKNNNYKSVKLKNPNNLVFVVVKACTTLSAYTVASKCIWTLQPHKRVHFSVLEHNMLN